MSHWLQCAGHELLGSAQPVIPPNLSSVFMIMFMNIITWGPQVRHEEFKLQLSIKIEQINTTCL